jgi:hypothetical protein
VILKKLSLPLGEILKAFCYKIAGGVLQNFIKIYIGTPGNVLLGGTLPLSGWK